MPDDPNDTTTPATGVVITIGAPQPADTTHSRTHGTALPDPVDRRSPTDLTPVLLDPTFGTAVAVLPTECELRRAGAAQTLVSGPRHWWQNWPKTHAYVADRMFFPTTVDELALAITTAEHDGKPVRAIGGGWSFSDAVIPGNVTTARPNVYAVEAIAEVVPLAQTYDADPAHSQIAAVADTARTADVADAMVMLAEMNDHSLQVDPEWAYLGGGNWTWKGGATGTAQEFLNWIGGANHRPIRLTPAQIAGTSAAELETLIAEADRPGSLVMFDTQRDPKHPSRDWHYHGGGVWSVGVSEGGDDPDQGTLVNLSFNQRLFNHQRTGAALQLSPRPGGAAASLEQLLAKPVPEPVYLINTRSMVSSLQQDLPGILSSNGRAIVDARPAGGAARRFLFHVEAGITIAELGTLLAHQSPRQSLQAISGSPGATLAGALATGTHGAEFQWPPVTDRVKAVHLVGPGGLQWWIEGSESIADPAALLARYPCLAPERIVCATSSLKTQGHVTAQDWLNAVVVSLGAMGVVYSIVLEVVPLFGVHEIVVQRDWHAILGRIPTTSGPALAQLRSWPSANARDVSRKVVTLLQDGVQNGTGIAAAANQYADLAFNPNVLAADNYDCWIGNRETVAHVPVDQKAGSDVLAGVTTALRPRVQPGGAPRDHLMAKLKNVLGLGSTLDLVGNAIWYSSAWPRLNRVTSAADTADVALDTLLTTLVAAKPDGVELAQALLTGILSGLLGTVEHGRSETTGVNVGNLGFPASGLMGAGLEIALPPAEAFGFLQVEILDRLNQPGVAPTTPFFGYISIRLCSQTQTLLGMTQWGGPCSVMIEVVAFGDPASRQFMTDLQQATLARIDGGLDAMLHWGLENDQLTEARLVKIAALKAPTASIDAATGLPLGKLAAWKQVRAVLQAGATGKRVFDSAFTDRLGL